MKKVLLILLLIPPTFAKGQSWVNVGIAGFSDTIAQYTSISIDISGTPYVVYSDGANNGRATVMKYTGSSWVFVGSAGFSTIDVQWTSIAIGNNGTPYVVYEEAVVPGISAQQATVMQYDGTDWVLVGNERFTGYMAECTSIKIDSSGTPLVCYFDEGRFNGSATVMKFDGSIWDTVGHPDFSAGYAYDPSMAIDANGTLYVAYAQSPFDSNYYNAPTTVMKYNGSNWVNVGNTCFSAGSTIWNSIALDSSGTPYVAYVDMAYNNKVTVMKYNGTSWIPVGSPGFSAAGAGNTSLAIDGSGTLYVVYRDSANSNKATVMKYDGSNWVTVGTAGFSSGEADYTSIVIDRGGTPYVVYADLGNGSKVTVMRYGWAEGVKNIEAVNNLDLYPNPATSSLTITSSNPINQITITNLLGQTVYSRQFTVGSSQTVDVSGFAAGVYFVKVNGVEVRKFVKE